MTSPSPLPVGARVQVVHYDPTDRTLSIANRTRLLQGKPVVGTVTDNDSFDSHHGYAVHLDVPGSTFPHRVFLPASYLERLDEEPAS